MKNIFFYSLKRLITFCLILLCVHLSFEANAQWSIKHLDEDMYTTYNVIKFKNDSLGLYMGDGSLILRSTDSGETWNTVDLDVFVSLKDFQFIEDSLVYAIGWAETSKFIRSTDNGLSWDSVSSLSGTQLTSLAFLNKDTGVLTGYNGIYLTTDAGLSCDTVWTIKSLIITTGNASSIQFTDNGTGYAIGHGVSYNINTLSILLKSYDKGFSWDTIFSFPEYKIFSSLHFINDSTGFIGTRTGKILKTTDGGYSWNTVKQFYDSYGVLSIHFPSDEVGYSVGISEPELSHPSGLYVISKTIDGGESWLPSDTFGISKHGIYFNNDSVGFVSGSYGLIMKTLNGEIDELPENYPWNLVKPYTYNVPEKSINNSFITAYPNPSTQKLYLEAKSTQHIIRKVKVFDINGRILISKEKPDVSGLDVSHLSLGIYFWQVSLDSGESSWGRFVKQ